MQHKRRYEKLVSKEKERKIKLLFVALNAAKIILQLWNQYKILVFSLEIKFEF